jgi:hypothetical protein
VHLERPAAVVVSRADGELQGHVAVLGDGQRGFEGEFFEEVAVDLLPRVQGEFDERRAGHEDRAEHDVVGEPRLSRDGQPSGEHQPVALGQ